MGPQHHHLLNAHQITVRLTDSIAERPRDEHGQALHAPRTVHRDRELSGADIHHAKRSDILHAATFPISSIAIDSPRSRSNASSSLATRDDNRARLKARS